jgi:hypothetical protein
VKNWARWVIAAGGAAAIVAVVAIRPVRSLPGSAASIGSSGPAAPPFDVPHNDAALTFDGELAEPAWLHTAARTGDFLDESGAKAIPFSEARVMWQSDRLLVSLYAADIDIETKPDAGVASGKEDVFEVTLRHDGRIYALTMGAGGERITTQCTADGWACKGEPLPWESGVEVGRDVDGTPNEPSDDDEEWVLEMAIPLRAIGAEPRVGERVEIRLRRCDFPRGAARACGTWSPGRTGAITLKG